MKTKASENFAYLAHHDARFVALATQAEEPPASRARTSHAETVTTMRPIADEAPIESCAIENEVASIEPAVRDAIQYAGTLVTVESAACLTRLETNLHARTHVGEAAACAKKRALEEVRAERSAASSRHQS